MSFTLIHNRKMTRDNIVATFHLVVWFIILFCSFTHLQAPFPFTHVTHYLGIFYGEHQSEQLKPTFEWHKLTKMMASDRNPYFFNHSNLVCYQLLKLISQITLISSFPRGTHTCKRPSQPNQTKTRGLNSRWDVVYQKF